MRILHLIHSEGVYGAELILFYLAHELQQLGHEPIVGSIHDPGSPETSFEQAASAWGLPVEQIRIPPRPTPGVLRSVLGKIRMLAPDVLHSHGYKADILLGMLPRRLRGPMLVTLHGWTSPPPLSALWLYEHLDRFCLRRMDRVVVVARHMLDLPSVRALSPNRRQVIENGIPSLDVRLAQAAASGVAAIPEELRQFMARRPTFVAIGRLSREKGFDLLLKAFALAAAPAAAHQLMILGEGAQRNALAHRIKELGLSASVRLGGYVEGAERALAGACGFVMSSLTEGMPLVLLEAMQRRTPVLATAVGAIPDILEGGRSGLLVPPNDVPALAAALRRMMSSDAQAAGAADAAHEAVSSRYASARMAAEYLDAYRAIAAANQ
jgi:glycosyltransferase involved in cell wall biosynthesis